MKKWHFIAMFAILFSCQNKESRIEEAKAKYEKEAKQRAIDELEEWHEMERLALIATGVTSSVKEERKLAYVNLIQKFPKSERWDDIVESIEANKIYSQYEDFIWEIKKEKGWVNIE